VLSGYSEEASPLLYFPLSAEQRRIARHESSMPAARAPENVFRNIYAKGLWRSGQQRSLPGYPASGGGSTELATRTTCRVLMDAVRMVSETPARRGRPIRILDAPCGDYTWMPACLQSIRTTLGMHLRYTGADIVSQVIEQLNIGHGSLLVNGTRASVGRETGLLG